MRRIAAEGVEANSRKSPDFGRFSSSASRAHASGLSLRASRPLAAASGTPITRRCRQPWAVRRRLQGWWGNHVPHEGFSRRPPNLDTSWPTAWGGSSAALRCEPPSTPCSTLRRPDFLQSRPRREPSCVERRRHLQRISSKLTPRWLSAVPPLRHAA